MKILFLTPQLPHPPRQGTQIRNLHIIRGAALAHQVDLLSFARPGEDFDSAGPLRQTCGRIMLVPAPRRRAQDRLRTLATTQQPDIAHRLPSAAFTATLEAALKNGGYDAVQVEGIEMARYIPVVRTMAPRILLVFDDHNAEYVLQGRAASVDAERPSSWPKAFYSLVQWQRLRRYETRVCNLADAVLAVSDGDADSLRSLGITTPVAVVPNGVDTEYYQPIPNGSVRDPGGLLFTGTMDFRPNVDAMVWFATEVLPLVVEERPDVHLFIVGRSPSPAVLRLADRNPRVTVTGPVDDVRPFFGRCSLFVVPIRMAGGARLKVLEALAMGMPMVSTSIGAEGIELADGREVVLADGREDFANALLKLLEAPSLQRPLSQAGRLAAEQRFSWDQVAPRLLKVYEEHTRQKQDGEGEI